MLPLSIIRGTSEIIRAQRASEFNAFLAAALSVPQLRVLPALVLLLAPDEVGISMPLCAPPNSNPNGWISFSCQRLRHDRGAHSAESIHTLEMAYEMLAELMWIHVDVAVSCAGQEEPRARPRRVWRGPAAHPLTQPTCMRPTRYSLYRTLAIQTWTPRTGPPPSPAQSARQTSPAQRTAGALHIAGSPTQRPPTLRQAPRTAGAAA